jgi:hypothetical protein
MGASHRELPMLESKDELATKGDGPILTRAGSMTPL